MHATEAMEQAARCRREVQEGRLKLLDSEALSLESDVDLVGIDRARLAACHLQATLSSLDTDLASHTSGLTSLDNDLLPLGDPSVSTFSASISLVQLIEFLDSARSTLAQLDREINAAAEEGVDWAVRRASRVQENRSRNEEEIRQAAEAKQRQEELGDADQEEEGEAGFRNGRKEIEGQQQESEVSFPSFRSLAFDRRTEPILYSLRSSPHFPSSFSTSRSLRRTTRRANWTQTDYLSTPSSPPTAFDDLAQAAGLPSLGPGMSRTFSAKSPPTHPFSSTTSLRTSLQKSPLFALSSTASSSMCGSTRTSSSTSRP